MNVFTFSDTSSPLPHWDAAHYRIGTPTPEGLGASLVKITAPLGAGSPAATPRVNGSAGMRPLRKQFVSVGFRAVYALLPNEQVRQRAVTFTQARIANAG
jgi:hypothetical protein